MARTWHPGLGEGAGMGKESGFYCGPTEQKMYWAIETVVRASVFEGGDWTVGVGKRSGVVRVQR